MYRTIFFKNFDHCRASLSNIVLKRYAGHNKWSNIKHIKGANDQQKSLLFSKLSRQMKLAIRELNDPNPATNSKLASIIEIAKKNSMPKDTILNTIKTHVLKEMSIIIKYLKLKHVNSYNHKSDFVIQ